MSARAYYRPREAEPVRPASGCASRCFEGVAQVGGTLDPASFVCCFRRIGSPWRQVPLIRRLARFHARLNVVAACSCVAGCRLRDVGSETQPQIWLPPIPLAGCLLDLLVKDRERLESTARGLAANTSPRTCRRCRPGAHLQTTTRTSCRYPVGCTRPILAGTSADHNEFDTAGRRES